MSENYGGEALFDAESRNYLNLTSESFKSQAEPVDSNGNNLDIPPLI